MPSGWTSDIYDNALDGVTDIATLEISLHTAEPDLTSNATAIASETAVVGRVEITAAEWNAHANDASSDGRLQDNSIDLEFGNASAGDTVSWLVIWDASGGTPSETPKGKIQLEEAKVINNGDPVRIPVGNLDLVARGATA